MNRLPDAFHPLVDSCTTYGRKITKLAYSDNKIHLGWKDSPLERKWQTEAYDYAITTVPLPVMRTWRLPALDVSTRNAIDDAPYGTACKVALQFRTRFWEHLPQPIYGSCSTTTDIPGIGQVCYPSYDINSTGPGVMLAQYSLPNTAPAFAAMTEEDNVAYVLDAMIEIHGDVAAEQYTGKYSRKCWALDEFATAGWAMLPVGARQVWLPSFFKTQSNIVFSGEGTSYTSAWIAAALESGVRASVQILLELGLVDEAKVVVDKWMARWLVV